MIPPRIRLSERSQVALIVFVAVGGLAAIWYFLLQPQAQMHREIASLRRQLAANPSYHKNKSSLLLAGENEKNNSARLADEWALTTERLATFANQAALRRSEFGRIDYKVELFATRQRLVEKSDALGIQLIPTDLGVIDDLKEQDQVRERMLQLKTVEKLADLTLDRRIERLLTITPLPPVAHRAPGGGISFDEYPVRVEFDVAFNNLYALMQSVFEEYRVFAFRNIRIESGPRPNSPVRVKAVMSALVFE